MPILKVFARHRETAVALLLLAGLTLIVRAPFWANAVMDWDESTFILMGQSIVDGHLPYTDLWDIKPPLLFALFAGFIGALGRSIVAIRLGGALFVYATSIVIFFLAGRFFDRASGIIGAALYILAASLFYNGQVTYSEHLAVLPLVGSVALLSGYPYPGKSLLRSLGLGACCCASCFIRANLIIPSIVIGTIAAIGTLRSGCRTAAYHIAACVLGGIVVFAAVMAPYGVSGNFDVFWDAVVVAPLAFQVSEGTSAPAARSWPCIVDWRLLASYGDARRSIPSRRARTLRSLPLHAVLRYPQSFRAGHNPITSCRCYRCSRSTSASARGSCYGDQGWPCSQLP
jgi:4-amino-4-deoxy-L-arabinose transferase-like glycosyltransferase